MTFLGIDGGGSKTAFLLETDAGQELARLETGPSNWLSSGSSTARESITAGITRLPTMPDVVCGGFAGAGRPEGIEFYRTCLAALLPKAQVIVETDAFITFIGAIGLKPGVLLIAGTGSIAATANFYERGERIRAVETMSTFSRESASSPRIAVLIAGKGASWLRRNKLR